MPRVRLEFIKKTMDVKAEIISSKLIISAILSIISTRYGRNNL